MLHGIDGQLVIVGKLAEIRFETEREECGIPAES